MSLITRFELWLRFQFSSSISISISISVFKVDLNLDLDFSFASASISVSISVFSFDLSFDFSFSSRSQFQLPASTLLEVDFESGFTDLCRTVLLFALLNYGTTPLQNPLSFRTEVICWDFSISSSFCLFFSAFQSFFPLGFSSQVEVSMNISLLIFNYCQKMYTKIL